MTAASLDPLQNAQSALRHVLAGNSPNGIAPGDCGQYADVVEEIYRAAETGGPESARNVFAALSKRHPELVEMVSGPDLQPETPSAFANNGWLPTRKVEAALNRSEHGDASLFAELYKGRLAYDHAEKQWYLWNGHHWEVDDRKQVINFVADQLAAQYIQYAATLKAAPEDDDEKKAKTEKQVKELFGRAMSLRNRNKINNILILATSQTDLSLAGDEWERDPMLLAVKNGVLDLRTGEFRPGRPNDYIRTVAPTAWQGMDTPAPRWEQFLREIFAGGTELIAFVQRLFGYAITGKVTEHVLPIFWGQGRNGKDTLLETLKAVLGPMAEPISKDVLIDKRAGSSGAASPHIYALRHLRLAWASETSAGDKFNVEQVKFLTGGGAITARPLYGNMVTFTPKYKLILLTNHKPKADSDDYALWKRLLLIPFTQSYVDEPKFDNEHKADKQLPDKLKAEAPGILAWLVRGCLAYQREGLNPPANVRLATEAYREEEDTLAQFIEERCVVNPAYKVEATPFYQAYREWATSNGTKFPLGSRTFGEKMAKRFKRDNGRIRTYYGIGLLHG